MQHSKPKANMAVPFCNMFKPKDAGTAVLGEDVVSRECGDEQTRLGGVGLLVVDTEANTLDEQGVFVCQLASRHISVATL